MPFFLLKGLSFLPFGGLLKNPKLLIGAIVIALLVFGYFNWKDAIKTAIYNELYAEQVEEHLENQRQELERIKKLAEESTTAVQTVNKERQKLLKDIEAARAATRNVIPERNGAVAPVLSEALDFIRARQASPEPEEETLRTKMDDVVNRGLDALRGTQEPVETTGNSAIDAWKKTQEEGQ